ncbi:hypothetical protein KI387_037825, partial [Taxus chinensis]
MSSNTSSFWLPGILFLALRNPDKIKWVAPLVNTNKVVPLAANGGQRTVGGFVGGLVTQGNISSKADPTSRANNASFKEVVQQKIPSASPAYIVDMADEMPLLSLDNREIMAHLQSWSQLTVIGRFNGIWSSSSALSSPMNKGGWNKSSTNQVHNTDNKGEKGKNQPTESGNDAKRHVNKASSLRKEENKTTVGMLKRGHVSVHLDKSDSDQEFHPDPSYNLMMVVSFDQNNWQE